MAEAFIVTPLSPNRRIVATRMAEAKRTIPHFRLVADIEIDALIALRTELHRHGDLSLNDFFIKGSAAALMDAPGVNIQWVEGEIRQFVAADIAVVTTVHDGLSTPIVRDADSKSVRDISREVKELTSRAAKNALRMEEISGGSFSISNLGMYGVDEFDAIINSPQCAILAIGCAKPRVVVSPERESRIATVVRVTLSLDHRAVDGVAGAGFLSALRHRLEHPEHMRPSEGG
jgi:pyruvate dehydrogenase E2 component (dihydrolipoamide acetyltransferase)